MNLGLLFNILGAAIFDGVPEDAEIIVCDDPEGSGKVAAIWSYIPGAPESPEDGPAVLISAYSTTEDKNIELLWEKTE
jgi:hypothetical protein